MASIATILILAQLELNRDKLIYLSYNPPLFRAC